MTAEVRSRLAEVRARIDDAVARAGRPAGVTLVAVSKTFPLERVREAYDAGQRAFGENRVQEAVSKIEASRGSMLDASWHLIGHLQSNKARLAVRHFDLIESVDSVHLARRLSDLAVQEQRTLPVLLEVNVAGEESKSGLRPDDVQEAVGVLVPLPGISLRGLMTVAPLAADVEDVRPVFRALREIRDRLRDDMGLEGFEELSMGMSNDYLAAIEEGATIVRLGRAIFGERPPR